jgi:hypothetical protein
MKPYGWFTNFFGFQSKEEQEEEIDVQSTITSSMDFGKYHLPLTLLEEIEYEKKRNGQELALHSMLRQMQE